MKLKKIGMLTPSSNTVLEPVTCSMLRDTPGASVHFSRFRVTEVNGSAAAAEQFAIEPMLEAARLLAEAKVDVIAYNGTSGGWLGFANDRRLCERVVSETGIPATTAVLALNELLAMKGVRRYGLVSPCEERILEKITANYATLGLACSAFACSGITDNYACGDIEETAIRTMIHDVALSAPEAIVAFGTNLRAAPLVGEMERELGIPIYDTVAVVLWKCLRMVKVRTDSVAGWGGLFQEKEFPNE